MTSAAAVHTNGFGLALLALRYASIAHIHSIVHRALEDAVRWDLLARNPAGEAPGLRWCDVDLEAGPLRIVQTLLQTKSTVEVGLPKASHGRRPVSLDPATVAVLRAHRTRMLQDRLLVGPDFTDRGFVFHHPNG
jgi:integrase